MNNETKSDTPETDAAIEQYAHLLPNWLATDIVGAVSRKLERERDRMQDLAEANGTLAHSNACEAVEYRRERDEWTATAAELSAERESNAMQALAYKAERDKALERADTMFAKYADILDHVRNERDEARKLFEYSKRARASLSEACDHLQHERDFLREALSACMEDSIELLSERGWWKDEPRSGYAERYAQTAENVIEAQALLATLQK